GGRRLVAEELERVVTDVEHAARDARAAGDGEVPRQLQISARDAGVAQRLEDLLHPRAPRLEHGVGRARAVAVGGERGRRRKGSAARVDEMANGDDVAM